MAEREVDAGRVRALAALLDETGLGEIEYETKEWRVRVVKPGAHAPAHVVAPPAPPPASQAAPAAQPRGAADHPGAVASPVVGTVYTSPEPGAPPYVRVGDTVRQGQTLVIVEAMKVMNPIAAPRAGRIAEILVANGQPVEYGEVMMIIE